MEIQTNVREQEEAARKQRLERKQLQEKIGHLKQNIQDAQELEQQLQQQIQQAQEQYLELSDIHERKTHIIDDTKYNRFNALNLPPHDTRFLDSLRDLWEKNMVIYLRQLCKSMTGLYALVDQKIQYLSEQPLFHVMKYVYNRITSQPIELVSSNGKNNEQLLGAVDNYMKIYLNGNEKRSRNQALNQLSDVLRSFLMFHQRSLLYLVICMQSSTDCTLNKIYNDDDSIHSDDDEDGDRLLSDIASSVTVATDNEDDNKFVSFYQEIYLRNNVITKAYQELAGAIQMYIDKDLITNLEVSVESLSSRLSHAFNHFYACLDEIHNSDSISAGSSCGTGVSPSLKTLNDKILQSLGSIQTSVLPNIFKTALAMERTSKQYRAEKFIRGTTVINDTEDRRLGYYQRRDSEISVGEAVVSDSPIVTKLTERARSYMERVTERYEQDASEYENISQREAIQNKKDLVSIQERCKVLEHDLKRYDELDASIRERQSHVNRLEQRVVDLFVEFQLLAQREQWIEEVVAVPDNEVIDIVDKLNRLGDFLRQTMINVGEKMRRLLRERNELEKEQQERQQSEVERQLVEASIDGDQAVIVSRTKDAEVRVRRHVGGGVRNPFGDLFTSAELNREQALKQLYEKRLEYLMRQIEVCDEKSVEYRVQWQTAVAQLEQAMEHERQMQLQLQQTRHLLEHTQDELKTVRINYENQIQVLSDSLTLVKVDQASSYNSTEKTDTPNSAVSGTGLFDFWSKRI